MAIAVCEKDTSIIENHLDRNRCHLQSGVTATPERLDGIGFNNVFDTFIQGTD